MTKFSIGNIEDETLKKRCLDEIPQTAQGKTIMTIEPKFVPSTAKVCHPSSTIIVIVLREASDY